MITRDQIRQFEEKGYLLIPGVLSKEEVALMRNKIQHVFESGEWKKSPLNNHFSISNVFEFDPEFVEITIKSKVIETIKALLGDNPILMPESAIHYQLYTPWHKDTTSQEKAGQTFHHTDKSLIVEAGFYMQDNDEYGGGLTVMESSHKTDDYFVKDMTPSFSERVLKKLFNTSEEKNSRINPHHHKLLDIPSKAGDLVIFNFKVNHRATLPKVCKIDEIPRDKKKIAFFNAFSINNETAYQYLDYIKSRKEPFYQNLSKRVISPVLVAKSKELGFTAL